MTRELGFYWVKFNGEWVVAEWFCLEHQPSRPVWIVTGDEIDYSDTCFEIIDERRIVRHEPEVMK